jgi:hypothetical protein
VWVVGRHADFDAVQVVGAAAGAGYRLDAPAGRIEQADPGHGKAAHLDHRAADVREQLLLSATARDGGVAGTQRRVHPAARFGVLLGTAQLGHVQRQADQAQRPASGITLDHRAACLDRKVAVFGAAQPVLVPKLLCRRVLQGLDGRLGGGPVVGVDTRQPGVDRFIQRCRRGQADHLAPVGRKNHPPLGGPVIPYPHAGAFQGQVQQLSILGCLSLVFAQRGLHGHGAVERALLAADAQHRDREQRHAEQRAGDRAAPVGAVLVATGERGTRQRQQPLPPADIERVVQRVGQWSGRCRGRGVQQRRVVWRRAVVHGHRRALVERHRQVGQQGGDERARVAGSDRPAAQRGLALGRRVGGQVGAIDRGEHQKRSWRIDTEVRDGCQRAGQCHLAAVARQIHGAAPGRRRVHVEAERLPAGAVGGLDIDQARIQRPRPGREQRVGRKTLGAHLRQVAVELGGRQDDRKTKRQHARQGARQLQRLHVLMPAGAVEAGCQRRRGRLQRLRAGRQAILRQARHGRAVSRKIAFNVPVDVAAQGVADQASGGQTEQQQSPGRPGRPGRQESKHECVSFAFCGGRVCWAFVIVPNSRWLYRCRRNP